MFLSSHAANKAAAVAPTTSKPMARNYQLTSDSILHTLAGLRTSSYFSVTVAAAWAITYGPNDDEAMSLRVGHQVKYI